MHKAMHMRRYQQHSTICWPDWISFVVVVQTTRQKSFSHALHRTNTHSLFLLLYYVEEAEEAEDYDK